MAMRLAARLPMLTQHLFIAFSPRDPQDYVEGMERRPDRVCSGAKDGPVRACLSALRLRSNTRCRNANILYLHPASPESAAQMARARPTTSRCLIEHALCESGSGLSAALHALSLAYICRVRGRTEQQIPCLRFSIAPPSQTSLPSHDIDLRQLLAATAEISGPRTTPAGFGQT